MSARSFAKFGFHIFPDLYPPLSARAIAENIVANDRLSGSSRCMLRQSWCTGLARELRTILQLRDVLPTDYVAVQCTYFEKSTDKNWLVPWHQDLSIPVASKIEHPNLHAWSEKEGQLFVQPPEVVLQKLIAVRLHLDPCTEEDGALRVIPGSHQFGKVRSGQVGHQISMTKEVICPVPLGGAMLLRPLLLHASSKSAGNNRRRVLHFLFAPASLPFGLAWQNAV